MPLWYLTLPLLSLLLLLFIYIEIVWQELHDKNSRVRENSKPLTVSVFYNAQKSSWR